MRKLTKEQAQEYFTDIVGFLHRNMIVEQNVVSIEESNGIIETPFGLEYDRTSEMKIRFFNAKPTEVASASTGTIRKSPQAKRDEIVEKAKRDVAELVRRGIDIANIGGKEGNYTYRYQFYNVEFIVPKARNRVVALVRWGLPEKELTGVKERGIAKCDPDDCFNVHIGKAIALRRALGLEVPTEYLNAPQPTEVRDYDVVLTTEGDKVTVTPSEYYVEEIEGKQAQKTAPIIEGAKIIDDSRDREASE